jgi:hypothetical protein
MAIALLARRVAHLQYAGTRGWSEANWCVRLRSPPTHGLENRLQLLAVHEEYIEYNKTESTRLITDKALAAVAREASSSSPSPSGLFNPSPEPSVPSTPLGRDAEGVSQRLKKQTKGKGSGLTRGDSVVLPLKNKDE